MKAVRPAKWLRLILVGGAMLQIGGCIGPNPGFFLSTSVANATIMNIVGAIFSGLLQGG
ncbi:MAG: hypothetical protein IID41_18400 [Planctomycetes bacterium]|nr:hypothetical protein [Planctomycetota bacterium]